MSHTSSTSGDSSFIDSGAMVLVSSCGAEKSPPEHLVDLQSIPGSTPGSAFTGIGRHSEDRVEVRLFPWAKIADIRIAIDRQLRLIQLLVPNQSRRVLQDHLQLSTPRLELQVVGQPLSTISNQLGAVQRLEIAKSLWKAASVAITGGLYQGEWKLENIWLTNTSGNAVHIDFLAKFYSEASCHNEQTLESESIAIIGIMCELLGPAMEQGTLLSTVSGQQRAQLRSLLRQRVESGCELEQFDRWSQFFASLVHPTHEFLPPSSALAPDKAWESIEQPIDGTCEVSIAIPTELIDEGDEKTSEIEVTPAVSIDVFSHFLEPGSRIGRFRADSILGQGGMGVVYRGVDLVSDEVVAIKLLRPSGGDITQAVRRFKKEARLLASIQNEYVTRLFDAGFENGFHYLAMEFVPGTNLREWLKSNPIVDETSSLKLIADVARALVDAHQQEIVHRDIKPENILLKIRNEGPAKTNERSLDEFQVKLSDFGIARTVQQSQSMEVTRAGTLLGTPTYMSPEQCKGAGIVSPSSDTYSLGVMLYTILCGQPPFASDDPMQLAAMHCFETPIDIQRRNQHVTDTTAALLSRMLAKDPAKRPSDAAQLVREIEKQLRGETNEFELHPRLPTSESAPIWERVFEWELKSKPAELWPYVSNTERLNRAAGLQSVQYRTEKAESGELRKFGTFKLAGMRIEWEEHPFEWIEGKRMGVLREFASGPFCWFLSLVELTQQPDGGTHLRHTVRVAPRGKLGRIVAALEAGWKGGRALDRIYRRIDESLQLQRKNALFDPYEPPAKTSTLAQRRAAQRVESMLRFGVRPELAQQLKDYVLFSAPQALAQIRPLDLSESLQSSAEETIDACLVAAHCGLLQLRWDILCPTCRAPASITGLLSEIGKHTQCEACDAEFQSNIASAIELIFQCHPEIRKFDDGQYCIGGPEHSPHVVTQLRLAPNERIELTVPVKVGDYSLRTTRSPQTQSLRVRSQAAPSNLDVCLSELGASTRTPVVRTGLLTLALTNDLPSTQVVRLERTIPRANVITAATASALPRFRELFPEQVFNRDQAIAAEELTLLAVRVVGTEKLYADRGDASGYQVLQQCFDLFEKCLVAKQGAVIKTVGETLLGSFRDSVHAISAALAIEEQLAERSDLADITIVGAVHRGPLLVTTQNGRLDYFGTTARQVQALCDNMANGLALTDAVFTDIAVQERLQQLPAEKYSRQNCTMQLSSGSERFIQLILPSN